MAKCYILYEVCDIQQYWIYGFIDKNIHWVTQTDRQTKYNLVVIYATIVFQKETDRSSFVTIIYLVVSIME